MSDSDRAWLRAVEEGLAVGARITTSVAEFDAACQHIVSLLEDASFLLGRGSHATSSFISITALEETAKVHIGMFRRETNGSKGRRSDPLFSHARKHHLASAPTVEMGSRLQKAIGEQAIRNLIEQARAGALANLRENALYLEQRTEGLQKPSEAISPTQAKNLLLFAIEAFDDVLVGFTNRSMELSRSTDALFKKWRNA